MQKMMLILIGAIVFTSGCLHAGGSFGGLFGSTQTNIEAPDDILIIRSAQVIPAGAIPANSLFDVTFQVQNTGGAETGKEATGAEVIGFDWGRCEPSDSISRTSGGLGLVGIPGQPVTIFPGGGTRLVEWTFRAPSNDKLGGVSGTCPIRFKTNYDFRALTVADISVVNEERLREANRAGETITTSSTQSKSEGPIKINIQIDAPQPVRTGTTVPLRITIEDNGEGLYNEAPVGTLALTFPSEFSDISCDDRVAVSGNTASNSQEIQLIKKTSPPIRCDVTVPSEETVLDLRTFNIQASLDYTYTLFGQVDVRINPTFERIGTTSGGSPSTGFEDSGGPDSSTAPTGFEDSGGPQ